MSTITFQSTMTTTKVGKKKGRSTEPGPAGGVQKPKKVNSEIRKQQNRIASRNYREKRKRKLQYLQQLLQDTPSTDQQPPKTPELSHDERTRSMSAEYLVSTPGMTPLGYASAPEYSSLSSTSGNIIDPTLVTTSGFNSPLISSSQPFTTVEPSWHQAIYDPLNDHPTTASWNAPWMPSADFIPQIHTPPPSDVQPGPSQPYQYYEHMSPSPQHTPQLEQAELYMLGPYHTYKRPVSQSQILPGVSAPFSSAYPTPPPNTTHWR